MSKKSSIEKYFFQNVFTKEERKRRLSKKTFEKLEKTINNKEPLDPSIAVEIAIAMKEWAVEKGANYYTHWFQPLTGSTAEKHDSFLDLSFDKELSLFFSGKNLIQGEPDASSFPSGGIRSTFEARGYTVWDPTVPAFIRKIGDVSTLYIPSVFFSYTEESLDLKAPFLRSETALQASIKRLFTLLKKPCKKISTSIGVEQEYFLIDRKLYNARPDLVACGRTLIGNAPYKGQELEDHYFGAIKPRVLQFMQDAEIELYKLGIPIITRHNEVAPSQYETAPIFQEANLTIDQNLLVMQILDETAGRHGLKLLLHEKPFANVNGSGKHCNFSISVDGKNLLDPDNWIFLLMLIVIIRAVNIHADLLRIAVSSAGNDHRLGANEAPPAIISIFLGKELTEIIEQIIQGKKTELTKKENLLTLGKGLPAFPRHNTDRNRTSPFAFTGNKFEFRALGSSQNVSSPNFTLNTVIAESIDYVSDQLEKKLANNVKEGDAIFEIMKEIWKDHSNVVFNGDNYSDAWIKEAKRRGLPNLKTSVDAFNVYTDKKNVALFEKYKVLSKKEIIARQNIRFDKYITQTKIEARALLDIISSMVLPSSYQQQEQLANTVTSIQKAGISSIQAQKNELKKLTQTINDLIIEKEILEKILHAEEKVEEGFKMAKYCLDKIIPSMLKIRNFADILEYMVDDSLWQLPNYQAILLDDSRSIKKK